VSKAAASADLDRSWRRTITDACVEMDFTGLFLIAASLALILLPLGLAPTAKEGWRTPRMVRIFPLILSSPLMSSQL